MNIAQALVGDTSGVRGGWWIVMCVLMMVCMAAMMLGMTRMGSRAARSRPAQRQTEPSDEQPLPTGDST